MDSMKDLIDQLSKVGKPVKVNLLIEIGESALKEDVKEEKNNPVGFDVN